MKSKKLKGGKGNEIIVKTRIKSDPTIETPGVKNLDGAFELDITRNDSTFSAKIKRMVKETEQALSDILLQFDERNKVGEYHPDSQAGFENTVRYLYNPINAQMRKELEEIQE